VRPGIALLGQYDSISVLCVFLDRNSKNIHLPPRMLNILIAEDHGIVRVGIIILIKELFTAVKIEETSNFNTTLKMLGEKKYDLLILDISIAGGNAFSMIELARLRQKDLSILVFSSYDEELYALRFLESGANGYVAKKASTDEIKIAIKKVIEKKSYVSRLVHEQLLTSFKNKSNTGITSLSNRELEIIRLLITGIGTKETGKILNLQKNTISTYKARIFKKLEVNNIIELAGKVKI
jgi:two-component system invasion response regulator UvrY